MYISGLSYSMEASVKAEQALCSEPGFLHHLNFHENYLRKGELYSGPRYCKDVPFARYKQSEIMSSGNSDTHVDPKYFNCLNRMDEASYIFNTTIFDDSILKKSASGIRLENLPLHKQTGFHCKLAAEPIKCLFNMVNESLR